MKAECRMQNAEGASALPPTDGTTFMAEARVIWDDGAFVTVDPVVGRMRFLESGELVWALGGLSVRGSLDAQVKIDRWTHAPQPGRTFAWLRDPRVEPAYDDGGDW